MQELKYKMINGTDFIIESEGVDINKRDLDFFISYMKDTFEFHVIQNDKEKIVLRYYKLDKNLQDRLRSLLPDLSGVLKLKFIEK